MDVTYTRCRYNVGIPCTPGGFDVINTILLFSRLAEDMSVVIVVLVCKAFLNRVGQAPGLPVFGTSDKSRHNTFESSLR